MVSASLIGGMAVVVLGSKFGLYRGGGDGASSSAGTDTSAAMIVGSASRGGSGGVGIEGGGRLLNVKFDSRSHFERLAFLSCCVKVGS